MSHSYLRKYRVLAWVVGQKEIFFLFFDNCSDFNEMVEYQEENRSYPDSFRTEFCGELAIPGFSYKPGHKEIAWFMGCYDAGAFFVVKVKPSFFYQAKTKCFLCRHFIIAPLETYDDRESFRLTFLYFRGSKRPV